MGYDGTPATYDKARDTFCNFVDEYAGASLLGDRMILQDVCPGPEANEPCTWVVDLTFYVAGRFVDDGVVKFCRNIFDEKFNHCGGSSDTAEVTLAAETGLLSVQVAEEDKGATCQGTSDDRICKAVPSRRGQAVPLCE